jgi:hypothetical protein
MWGLVYEQTDQAVEKLYLALSSVHNWSLSHVCPYGFHEISHGGKKKAGLAEETQWKIQMTWAKGRNIKDKVKVCLMFMITIYMAQSTVISTGIFCIIAY